MAVKEAARRILFEPVALFFRLCAARDGTVLLGEFFSLCPRLLSADLAEVDDFGHRKRYFLRKASSETTSAPFWPVSSAFSAGLAAGSDFAFDSDLRVLAA